uniref:Putative esterase and lipase n=1 Tax=Rhipicephalus microplus TaxID=6941 RepID=A0A6M2D9C2_RHIMP
MHLTLSTRSSKWTMYTSTAAFLLSLLMPTVLSDDYVVVTTMEGKVRGLRENVLGRDVDVFLGIPFAAPPVEELRFRKPHPDWWSGSVNDSHSRVLRQHHYQFACFRQWSRCPYLCFQCRS